jgi:hypothetical protein
VNKNLLGKLNIDSLRVLFHFKVV